MPTSTRFRVTGLVLFAAAVFFASSFAPHQVSASIISHVVTSHQQGFLPMFFSHILAITDVLHNGQCTLGGSCQTG